MGRILVVDDHADSRRILEKFITLWGHNPVAAESGEAALALLVTDKPDLIIVDGMMPGMNGAEFIRLLRADIGTALIPAILYTAVGDPNFAQNAREKGANEIWLKGTIDFPDMRRRVEQYLISTA